MAFSDFRFDNLSRPMQTLIYSVLVGCAAFVFYTHHLKGLLAELRLIQADIETLELSLSKETAIENHPEFLEQELEQLKKQFDSLKNVLSMQKEMPEALSGIQQMAASSNLKINKLTPEPVGSGIFCSDWGIRIEASGNFNGLGLFFEKISRASKTINVGAISIKAYDNPTDTIRTLTAVFTATIFIFREELPEALEDNEDPANDLTGIMGAVEQYSGNNTAKERSLIRYVHGNRRDPFLNPLLYRKQPLPNDENISSSPLSAGIAGTAIDELRFEGTSFRNDRRLAIIRGADNHAYFLEEGDRLFDGYLKIIHTDFIILVRETTLRSGKILTQDVIRRLRNP